MVEIRPFRGLRYAEPYASSEVYAPPYDVITPARRVELMTQSANNIVHLDLGPTPADPAWYGEARNTLQNWLHRDVLRRDRVASFYGYRQSFGWAGRRYVRTGLIARMRLMPWGRGVHRHELTHNQPKADRLALLRALDMQTSPVFGLFEDWDGQTATLLGSSCAIANDADVIFAEADGVEHLLWRIGDDSSIQRLGQALAQSDVVIADGHHRYETALALASERRAASGQPSSADYVLVFLTPLDDPGLLVLATHRVIKLAGLDVDRVLTTLDRQFKVMATDATLTKAMQGRSGVFGLVLPGRSFLLVPRHGDADRNELDVVRLQRMILEPVLGIAPQQLADSELVGYTVDEQEARTLVDSGKASLALILNPTPLQAIWRTALRGEVMPQKSTFFHPKLLTGLVMNPLWD